MPAHHSGPCRFLAALRLTLLAHLKTSGIVEHVLQLDVGPVEDGAVKVEFVGRRAKVFENVKPVEIRVVGLCPVT